MSHLALDPGLRRDVATVIKANVRALLVGILHDQHLHAEVVAAGPFMWRERFAREMGAFFRHTRGDCDQLANVVYRFLSAQWRDHHAAGVSAGQFLDAYAPVSPPTEQEIEEAWEVEIASSTKAMHTFYEGEARTRKGADLGSRRRPREEDDE